MVEDAEPVENISGGPDGGGVPTDVAANEPATIAEAVVDRLGELYWRKMYGGQDAFECLVRTVLSQNTSDKASQPAYDALLDEYGTGDLAAQLATADREDLAAVIQPAGLYNQKSKVLIDLAERLIAEFGDTPAFDDFVKTTPPEKVRATLLEWNGVGPKTADCVLLFAGGRRGVFPVDTHVHRIYRRLGIAPPAADHEEVRAILEREVPPEKCGFGHTASIQFGREYCTAQTPRCLDGLDACPLSDLCDRVGVDEAGVVDPADLEP